MLRPGDEGKTVALPLRLLQIAPSLKIIPFEIPAICRKGGALDKHKYNNAQSGTQPQAHPTCVGRRILGWPAD